MDFPHELKASEKTEANEIVSRLSSVLQHANMVYSVLDMPMNREGLMKKERKSPKGDEE